MDHECKYCGVDCDCDEDSTYCIGCTWCNLLVV